MWPAISFRLCWRVRDLTGRCVGVLAVHWAVRDLVGRSYGQCIGLLGTWTQLRVVRWGALGTWTQLRKVHWGALGC